MAKPSVILGRVVVGSPFLYLIFTSTIDLWHLRPGAPRELKDIFVMAAIGLVGARIVPSLHDHCLKAILNARHLPRLCAHALHVGPFHTGRILGYLLPQKIRDRIFSPVFEELAEDRLMARLQYPQPFIQCLIECMFCIRMIVAYLGSLGCWFSSPLTKVFPYIKSLFLGN